jgi:hypothetical protein
VSPEEAVRKFFDCYTNGRPEAFRSTRHALIGDMPA